MTRPPKRRRPRLAQVVAERGGLSEALGLRRRELAAWEAAVGAEDPRTDLDGPGGLGTGKLFHVYSKFIPMLFHFFLKKKYQILYNVIPMASCGFHGEFRGFLVGLESHEMWTGWDFDRNVGNL